MIKIKLKPTGVKSKEEAKPIVAQPELKENKGKTSSKKVVYISKRGSKAIFDSIGLCAKIFGKDATTIKYRIEHPKAKGCLDFDWLEGGRLEYYNN